VRQRGAGLLRALLLYTKFTIVKKSNLKSLKIKILMYTISISE
jgi:hypothetical protein